MKRYCILLLALLISACASTTQKVERTGKVIIMPFETTDFVTSDPVDIRQDVVESVRDNLRKRLEHYLLRDSKMVAGVDCDGDSMKLVGKIREVNAETDHNYRFVMVKSTRKFEVAIKGQLLRCRDNSEVVDFRQEEDGDNMKDIIDQLAEYVVDEIRYEKIELPTQKPL